MRSLVTNWKLAVHMGIMSLLGPRYPRLASQPKGLHTSAGLCHRFSVGDTLKMTSITLERERGKRRSIDKTWLPDKRRQVAALSRLQYATLR